MPMTEAHWLTWPDPYDLLEQCALLELTDRRLRLFACACCRRLWDLLEDDCLRRAIDVAEKFADSQATAEDLLGARTTAADFLDGYILRYWPETVLLTDDLDLDHLTAEQQAALQMPSKQDSWDVDEAERRWAVRLAAEAVVAASSADGDDGRPYLHHVETVILETSQAQVDRVGWAAERSLQASLLRDIFGNPYRQVSIKSGW